MELLNGTTGLTDAETVARALNGRRSGGGWVACCPAHDDKKPSLSIADGENGTLLVHCHAGCSQASVISKLKSMELWSVSRGADNREPEVHKIISKKKRSHGTFGMLRNYIHPISAGRWLYILKRGVWTPPRH